MAAKCIQVVSDNRFQTHRGPDGHPERPERLVAVADAIAEFQGQIEFASPRPASPDEIMRVHDRRLFTTLESTSGQILGQIDADTYYSPLSFDIACLAAGSCIDLSRRVLEGEVSSGLAAVRPPGHHAESDQAMGFCLFNNVAIAARALQAECGAPRILIFDWDVHHGNGTQHIFESDADVLYISTHQFPFYPGTGNFGEVGIDRGLGATINIPMPAGCGDVEYVGVVQRIVVPATIAFAPDIILISCGFDAHRDDPLASMELTQAGYYSIAAIMRQLSETLCEGRIAFVLEGGYSLDGVREGTRAILETMTQSSSIRLDRDAIELESGSMLKKIVDQVVEIHGRRIRDLGSA